MLNFDWASHVRVAMATAGQQRWQANVAVAFGERVEAHSAETLAHSVRVASHAVRLAQRLGLETAAVRELRLAALLHDLGKACIPAWLLEKRGSLTDDEHRIMQTHSQEGHQIAVDLRLPAAVCDSVHHHHEHWDGSGYPTRLRGAAIPLSARILTVADIFDALTSERSYREALSHDAALEIMAGESGRTVDPALLRLHSGLMDTPQRTRAAVLRFATQSLTTRLATAAA